MFQKSGAQALRYDLSRIETLCARLDNPQSHFPSVHVAGTNGKGSSSHMLASVFQASGYRVGLYTSPHLKTFRERIRIGGEMIREEEVVSWVERLIPGIEDLHPSFFEVTVALAFAYFREKEVDLAVIETGLGGRLDSTNILRPLVSLITNIGWDHQAILGDTLEKIAREKAGIIKPGVPCVLSETQEELLPVFEELAQNQVATLYQADKNYSVTSRMEVKEEVWDVYAGEVKVVSRLKSDVPGEYQRKNVVGVWQCLDILQERGFPTSLESRKKGLENIRAMTGLRGRWQMVSQNPYVVCDIAHNATGVRQIIRQLSRLEFDRLYLILGFSKDKDLDEILNLFPTDAFYYFCSFDSPRTVSQNKLLVWAKENNRTHRYFFSVDEAFAVAKRNSSREDLILITGSAYLLAEFSGF